MMLTFAEARGIELLRAGRRAADFIMLTKPRILMMVLLTTLAGFSLGSSSTPSYGMLLQVLVGTALAGGGTLALNQFLERDVDARMVRTRLRPLPAGRLQPMEVLRFGALTTVAGLLYLATAVNVLSSVAAAVTVGSYLFLYTPLKRKTAWCIVAGAVSGALPPVIGWAAASERFGIEVWVLFAFLFLWQLPHTLAIAMLYRDDYARVGIRLLPVIDPDGKIAGRQIVCGCLALLVVSVLPTLIGFAGAFYFLGALTMGIGIVGCGFALIRWQSVVNI